VTVKIKLVKRGRERELQPQNPNEAARYIQQGSGSYKCLSYRLVMWSREGPCNKHQKYFTV